MHKVSDTQSILMYHSSVKVLKNCGFEFKIKLQSLIYNIVCYIHIINLSKYVSNNICLYFQKVSDMLNKNTPGVKKVQGQSEAALQIGMCDQKL